VRGPSVAIAPGAFVRGFVQAGEPEATPATRATETSRATPTSSTATRVGAKPQVAAPAVTPPHAVAVARPSQARASTTQARPQTTRAAVPAHPPAVPAHPPASQSSPRHPPPPVVPAFKKARGQMVKKRER
jgi:hypothetical protein